MTCSGRSDRAAGQLEEAAVFHGQRDRPLVVHLLVHTSRLRRLSADSCRGTFVENFVCSACAGGCYTFLHSTRCNITSIQSLKRRSMDMSPDPVTCALSQVAPRRVVPFRISRSNNLIYTPTFPETSEHTPPPPESSHCHRLIAERLVN